jgi:HPt (histidine-containing phosphotransfer) domain-containing protein
MANDSEAQESMDAALDLNVLQAVVEIVGADEPSVVVDLIDTFLTDSQRQVDELRRSFASGDIKNVHRLAHSMKSSSATFGAMALSRICEALERSARDNCADGSCRDAIEALAAEHQRVLAELRVERARYA